MTVRRGLARLRPGVELVLEATGFDRLLAGATLVVTGEGRADAQTRPRVPAPRPRVPTPDIGCLPGMACSPGCFRVR